MGSLLRSEGSWPRPRIRAAGWRGGAARNRRPRERGNVDDGLERADTVTVRRLAYEVNWVFEARDVCGADVSLDPPSLDSVPVSPVAQAIATSTAAAVTPAEATSTAAGASSAAIVQIGAHQQDAIPVGARPEGGIGGTKNGTRSRAALEACDGKRFCAA